MSEALTFLFPCSVEDVSTALAPSMAHAAGH
jgi:hypothetical protein